MLINTAAVLVLLFAGAQDADRDARALAAAEAEAANRSTDIEIEEALWRMLEKEPDRVVCTQQIILGSRQQKAACGTIERWFNARQPSEVARKRAPWQLVEGIKRGRKEAMQKRRGG